MVLEVPESPVKAPEIKVPTPDVGAIAPEVAIPQAAELGPAELGNTLESQAKVGDAGELIKDVSEIPSTPGVAETPAQIAQAKLEQGYGDYVPKSSAESGAQVAPVAQGVEVSKPGMSQDQLDQAALEMSKFAGIQNPQAEAARPAAGVTQVEASTPTLEPEVTVPDTQGEAAALTGMDAVRARAAERNPGHQPDSGAWINRGAVSPSGEGGKTPGESVSGIVPETTVDQSASTLDAVRLAAAARNPGRPGGPDAGAYYNKVDSSQATTAPEVTSPAAQGAEAPVVPSAEVSDMDRVRAAVADRNPGRVGGPDAGAYYDRLTPAGASAAPEGSPNVPGVEGESSVPATELGGNGGEPPVEGPVAAGGAAEEPSGEGADMDRVRAEAAARNPGNANLDGSPFDTSLREQPGAGVPLERAGSATGGEGAPKEEASGGGTGPKTEGAGSTGAAGGGEGPSGEGPGGAEGEGSGKGPEAEDKTGPKAEEDETVKKDEEAEELTPEQQFDKLRQEVEDDATRIMNKAMNGEPITDEELASLKEKNQQLRAQQSLMENGFSSDAAREAVKTAMERDGTGKYASERQTKKTKEMQEEIRELLALEAQILLIPKSVDALKAQLEEAKNDARAKHSAAEGADEKDALAKRTEEAAALMRVTDIQGRIATHRFEAIKLEAKCYDKLQSIRRRTGVSGGWGALGELMYAKTRVAVTEASTWAAEGIYDQSMAAAA